MPTASHRIASPASRRLLIAAAALGVLGLGACRTDGGFGRYDSEVSRKVTARQFNDRLVRNWHDTLAHIDNAPVALMNDISTGPGRLGRTFSLYVEGATGRVEREERLARRAERAAQVAEMDDVPNEPQPDIELEPELELEGAAETAD